MGEKPEESVNEQLQYLVKENILLHSQFKALKTVFKVLYLSELADNANMGLSAQEFEELYQKDVENQMQKLLVSHPLLEESWKSQLWEALSDIPGLNLK